ncbi:hypothetical protein K9L27_04110 [Candidatus Gracilibacteria bacterium]|nr:hypothetical protein [Candidatus Gracilibacteria bacterium]
MVFIVWQVNVVDFSFYLEYNNLIYSSPQMTSPSTSLSSATDTSLKKEDQFRVGMILPMTQKNNADVFLRAVEAMSELGFQVSALAEGDNTAQKKCFDLLQGTPKFELLESTPQNRNKILAHSDVLLFPASPEKKDIEYVAKEGIVSVLPEGCGLENFDAQKETGNAFTFVSGKFWDMMASLIRASENHKFSYDWKNIQKNLKEAQL